MSSYSIEDIARFAEGDMTEEERLQFSAALETDQQLSQQLKEYHHIHSSLRMKLVDDESDKALKASLDDFGKEYFGEQARVVPFRRYITWAASIAAVFVLFLIWAPWQANVYEQYAATIMPATAERGEGNIQQEMQDATKAFNEKDFSLAKAKLETVLKADPTNNMAILYYGISLIETDETEKARKNLLVVFNGESVFKYDSGFYIALSYLKEKKEKECINWLKKIPSDAANYDKAQKLIRELE
jgi:hypothetical protein